VVLEMVDVESACADMRLRVVGVVRSPLVSREDCPRQGIDGGVEAEVELAPEYAEAMEGLEEGRDAMLLTWLHLADREALKVHPRGDEDAPLRGVFATRSPSRPNPVGLHRVRIVGLNGTTLRVYPLEVLDGTPVIDIKAIIRGEEPGLAE
jgi:L-fuculose-phosphate aldolase